MGIEESRLASQDSLRARGARINYRSGSFDAICAAASYGTVRLTRGLPVAGIVDEDEVPEAEAADPSFRRRREATPAAHAAHTAQLSEPI